MLSFIRAFRRHYSYFYHALRTVTRLDVLPAWAVGRRARVVCLAGLVLLFVAYIGVVSAAASSGYKMNKLEKEATGLKQDIEKIEVRIAEYNAMGSLAGRIEDTGMVAVEDIRYISATAPAVAKR